MQSRFARFVLVGSAATLTTYAVLIAGVEWLGMSAVLWWSFTANRRWTFARQG
jgi:putative flippase GtrA